MSDVPFARPSSTVILARDTDAEPEFLLVRRVVRSSFGGAHVFPGGVVDEYDEAAATMPSTLDAHEADRRLDTEGALKFYSAALRELLEETGIVIGGLASTPGSTLRDELLADGSTWPAMLERGDIRPAFDRLCYISEWITPDSLPKRYATRFFIAIAGDDQEAIPCGGELTECRWMSASDALAAGDEESIVLHPPTRLTLEQLARHSSVSSLLDWARDVERRGAPTIAATHATLESVRAALAGRAEVEA